MIFSLLSSAVEKHVLQSDRSVLIRSSRGAIAAAIAVAVMLGCAPVGERGRGAQKSASPAVHAPLTSEWARGVNALTVNEVAVLPLTASGRARTLAPTDLNAFTGSLVRSLQNNTSLSVLNVSAPDRVRSAAQSTERAQPPLTRATEFGRALGVQGVLHGTVTRFDTPESGATEGAGNASFTLWLVDAEKGQTVWTATFQDQMEPLTDNLLAARSRIQRGIGYQSSQDYLIRGFEEAARDLEQGRREARTAAR